jgi:hypothetical protein
LPTSAATDVFDAIASAAAAESPLWAEQLRAGPLREPAFGPLVRDELALGVETIYEGYLVHYGRSRLFSPVDGETALLLGDYLYAHGLVHVSATGDLAAVATLAELISFCAHLRAGDASGDGEAWLEAARRLGGDPVSRALAERALAAHARLLG